MVLYKFIEKKFLDAFFKTGCLRLGTIYDFKDTAEHGAARGDSEEGIHYLTREFEGNVSISKETYEPIISEMIRMEEYGQASIVGPAKFVVPRLSGDGFVFCTSQLYNETLFEQWHQENREIDSCYKIKNSVGFFHEINLAVANSAKFIQNSNIFYIDNKIDYKSKFAKINPAFTKVKEKYDWQYENRSLWGVKGPCGRLKPWIIFAPDAIKYCRPFASMSNGVTTYTNV